MDQQIKDMICKHLDTEMDKISKMPSLNDASLNNLHILTDTKKNLLKIEILEKQLEDDGYSNRRRGGSYDYDYSRRDDGSYMHMMPIPQYRGGSYDNMGGNSRNDAYSHLEAAMRDARTESEREAIRQAMSKMYV